MFQLSITATITLSHNYGFQKFPENSPTFHNKLLSVYMNFMEILLHQEVIIFVLYTVMTVIVHSVAIKQVLDIYIRKLVKR